MHATTRYPVPSGAEMAPASTLDHAGQAAPPVRPASGDADSVPSQKIVDIIGVIDEIVLQTRTLAQSTAVEAARAGEQGGSFFLVANEVKRLAQRSAAALREIRGMVGDSVCRAGMADEDRQREFEERARRWQKSLVA